MDIKRLLASDFPGIDSGKFGEWKTLKLKLRREVNWALALMMPILVVPRLLKLGESALSMLLKIAMIAALPVAVFMLFSALLTVRRLDRLDKEIGMTERLKALQGRHRTVS